MSQDSSIVADTATIKGASTLGGAITASSGLTVTGDLLLSNKKLGMSASGDVLDLSGAQGILKLGPTSTTLQLAFKAISQNFIDNGGTANQINSFSRFTGSTNAATAHNYAGTTPDFVSAMCTGTATAFAAGTFTGTQCTPAMTSAQAYIGLATKS